MPWNYDIIRAVNVFLVRFFFPLGQGNGGGESQFYSILQMVFNIIPSNPVQPFLEKNTLQIVFLAVIVGTVLLLTGQDGFADRDDPLCRQFFSDLCTFRCFSRGILWNSR